MRLMALVTLWHSISWAVQESPKTANDPEAEALFRKLVEKVQTSKTLQITCQGQFKTAGFEAEVKASLLMKEGNKMRLELEMKGTKEGEPTSYSIRMVSNGSMVRMREKQGAWIDYATAESWNDLVVLNIARGGFPSGLELMRLTKEGDKEAVSMAFRPVAQPTAFVLCKPDQVGRKEATPIGFTVKNESEFAKEISAFLWLDPATTLPLKRMNVIRSDRTLTVTEDCEKFLVNESIDDSSFELPKEN